MLKFARINLLIILVGQIIFHIQMMASLESNAVTPSKEDGRASRAQAANMRRCY